VRRPASSKATRCVGGSLFVRLFSSVLGSLAKRGASLYLDRNGLVGQRREERWHSISLIPTSNRRSLLN
jgi:hypothetical protein